MFHFTKISIIDGKNYSSFQIIFKCFRKLNLTGTAVSLKPLTKLLNCCDTLASLNLTSCRALPRGMKRMYHSRDDVQGLIKDITDGKFDARDHGSDDDD